MLFPDNYAAMSQRIDKSTGLDGLVTQSQFITYPTHKTIDDKAIGKLLLNAWSAEYALRITPVVNDEQYLQSSLHWTFPQAYYSTLFSSRAFLSTQGINTSHEDLIKRRIGALVARGYYPEALGYFALGGIDCKINRLEPDSPVAVFLTETRYKLLKELKRSVQCNPKTALRSPGTGEVIMLFSKEQYKELARQLGYTSYFDLVARLRISSTNREIEKLALDTIDVRVFHAHVSNITGFINSVHELYIAKAIGLDAYGCLVNSLPSYLGEGFVRDRLNGLIRPILHGVHDGVLG